jgi:hypothetical protein
VIAISTDGSGTLASEDSLFFEPPYQTPGTGNPALPNQGAPALNTWQKWNVFTGGLWDNDGSYNPGTTEGSTLGVGSLADFLALYPNATIMNNTAGAGNEGITLFVGEGSPSDNFNGYVDNVTIGTASGTTTYDFEPTVVPEPTTLISCGAMLLPFAGSAFRMLQRKKTA